MSAIRARIADIDPDSIQEVVAQAVAARVNGPPDDCADDHVKMVSRIIDAGGVTEELIVDAIHGELVRHVMLM